MLRTIIYRSILGAGLIGLIACGQMSGKIGGSTGDSSGVANHEYLELMLSSTSDALTGAPSEDGEPSSSAKESQDSAGAGGLNLDGHVDGPNSFPARCMTIETVPSPLTFPLPANFNVAWAFDDCPIGFGATQSGTHRVDVIWGPFGSTRDFSGERDITRESLLGGRLDIDSSYHLYDEGFRVDGVVNRTLDAEAHRVRLFQNGSTWYDINVTLEGISAVDEFDSDRQRTRRTLNGNITLIGNLAETEVSATMTDLVVEPALCCHPISGSITMTIDRPKLTWGPHTYTFNGVCGEAEMDTGETITFRSCDDGVL